MKETKIIVDGCELTLIAAKQQVAGYGRRKISVLLFFKGCTKWFDSTTTDMPGFDAVIDIWDCDEKELAFYEMIESKISEIVTEWIRDVIEGEERLNGKMNEHF
jgi:hypothetical protein